jgi:hypothetical protein
MKQPMQISKISTRALIVVFSVIRYLLMVPAAIFTIRYQKTAMQKYFGDIDGLMAKQRVWAYIGLAITLVALGYHLVCFITWCIKRPARAFCVGSK